MRLTQDTYSANAQPCGNAVSNVGVSCEQGGDNRVQVIVGFTSSRVRVAARRIGADPLTTVRFWPLGDI
jgi:hypothetical protein